MIGAMVLNEGTFAGKQIVSDKWIAEMITPRRKLGERFGFMGYGYLWYKPYEDKEVYAAIGDSGGQGDAEHAETEDEHHRKIQRDIDQGHHDDA